MNKVYIFLIIITIFSLTSIFLINYSKNEAHNSPIIEDNIEYVDLYYDTQTGELLYRPIKNKGNFSFRKVVP